MKYSVVDMDKAEFAAFLELSAANRQILKTLQCSSTEIEQRVQNLLRKEAATGKPDKRLQVVRQLLGLQEA